MIVIANPGARGGRARGLLRRYHALLLRRGVRAEFRSTRDLADAGRLAAAAARAGARTVVAAGGDGTIRAVAEALARAAAPPALGVLYAGTSPDFCRFHGLPLEPVAAVDALLDGGEAPIDLGRVVCAGRERLFTCSVNLGLGAGIAARANRWRPRCGDALGTCGALLATLARTPGRDLDLACDEATITCTRLLNLTIGKNPFLASGLRLAVDIRPDDGRLYAFALCGLGRSGLIAALPRLYDGSLAADPRCRLLRLQRCMVADGAARLECDGDPWRRGSFTVTVLPGALRLKGARRG